MWHQRDDGTPMLPEGVPDPVPLRSLRGNVVVDCTKKNQEKEIVQVGECLTKQSFIQQGIAKHIEVWKTMMARDAMYAKDMAAYVHYWERLYSEITGPVLLVTGIASLCGLIVLHQLLIYPLVAITGLLLWSDGHQCVQKRSQSH